MYWLCFNICEKETVRFLPIILFFMLACAAPKDYKYTIIEVCNDTIPMEFFGIAKLCVQIPQKDSGYHTYIMTDNYCVWLYGKVDISSGTKTYIIYPNEKSKSIFYCEGKRQTYKIVKQH